MNLERVEQLLSELSARVSPRHLFSPERREQVQRQIRQLAARESASYAPPRRKRMNWQSAAIRLTACAAAILFTVQLFRAGETMTPPALVTCSSFDRADLFHVQRSTTTTAGDRLFIGVELRVAASIRILALEADGRLTRMALNRDGAETIAEQPGQYPFGGFALQSPADSAPAGRGALRTHFFVIASAHPLSDESIEHELANGHTSGAGNALESRSERAAKIAARLERALRARVQVVPVPTVATNPDRP